MPEPLEGAFQSGGALHPYLLDLDFSTASADSCLCHGVICVSFGAQGRQGLCASSLEKRSLHGFCLSFLLCVDSWSLNCDVQGRNTQHPCVTPKLVGVGPRLSANAGFYNHCCNGFIKGIK